MERNSIYDPISLQIYSKLQLSDMAPFRVHKQACMILWYNTPLESQILINLTMVYNNTLCSLIMLMGMLPVNKDQLNFSLKRQFYYKSLSSDHMTK